MVRLVSLLLLCVGPVGLAASPGSPLAPGAGGGGVAPIPGGGALPPSAGGGGGLPPSAGGGGVPLPAGPRIVLGDTGLPRHGDVIGDNDPNYDAGSEALWVGGRVTGLANPAGWLVFVQGAPVASPLFVGANGEIEFAKWIDVSDNQPSTVPYATWLDDDNRPLIGVLAELVDPNGVVRARDRIVLYDVRGENGMYPRTPTGLQVRGVAAQLTTSGLDALEPVHLGSLFYPSAADFQTDLDAAVAAHPTLTHGLGEPCVTLASGHPLVGTAAYDEAFLVAQTLFLVHEALENPLEDCAQFAAVNLIAYGACIGVLTGAKEAICVDEQPNPNDFEACVRLVDLEPTRATVDGVTAVDLEFDDQATLTSSPTLTGLDADYKGVLRDIVIRWADDGCLDVPETALKEDDYLIDEVLDWRTCTDLGISAPEAEPTALAPLAYDVSRDGETIGVDYDSGVFAATPDFYDPGQQTCGEDWIAGQIDLALLAHAGDLASFATEAWRRDDPTDESVALDLLLSPYEMGLATPRLVKPLVDWEEIATDPIDGLWLEATTDAVPTRGGVLEPTTWLLHEADDHEWLLGGFDPDGEAFDVALAVTTGYLNQTLRAGYGTGLLLDRKLKITRGDLGATTDTSRVVNLDGTVLAQRVDPVFAEIGNQSVTLTLDATLAPFTLMERDPPGVDAGEYAVSFNAPGYEVVLEAGGQVWARFAVDLHQTGIEPQWSAPDQTLGFQITPMAWTWRAVEWNFATCAMAPAALGIPTCETNAVGALGAVATPAIQRLLQSMIAEIPAPRVFDADGSSGVRRDVAPTVTGTWRDGQVITVFGVLE